jgi:dihydroorotase
LLDAFSNVGELAVPVAVHAEDKKIVDTVMEEERRCNRKDINAYVRAHTPEAEVKAVERILKIAQKTALQLHFCHISSKKAVSFIQEARRNGLSVSCEVTPHHLLLTSEDLIRNGNVLLTDPPLRKNDIVDYLWKATKSSWIDIVSTDHAPHLFKEKQAESIWNVKPGIPGLETLLPLLLTQVNENRLSIDDLVTLTSEKPAEIFHLQSMGSLKEGYDANITIVDMNRKGKIQVDGFHSKAKYSPFEGWQVKGLPVMTFVNGKLAMDDGEIVAKGGTGRIIQGGD